jgi:hypothetical protein
MMKKLLCIAGLDESLEVFNPYAIAVTRQCDLLDIDPNIAPTKSPQVSSDELFLDLYSKFTGVSEVDNLSWQTLSFRDSKHQCLPSQGNAMNE